MHTWKSTQIYAFIYNVLEQDCFVSLKCILVLQCLFLLKKPDFEQCLKKEKYILV